MYLSNSSGEWFNQPQRRETINVLRTPVCSARMIKTVMTLISGGKIRTLLFQYETCHRSISDKQKALHHRQVSLRNAFTNEQHISRHEFADDTHWHISLFRAGWSSALLDPQQKTRSFCGVYSNEMFVWLRMSTPKGRQSARCLLGICRREEIFVLISLFIENNPLFEMFFNRSTGSISASTHPAACLSTHPPTDHVENRSHSTFVHRMTSVKLKMAVLQGGSLSRLWYRTDRRDVLSTSSLERGVKYNQWWADAAWQVSMHITTFDLIIAFRYDVLKRSSWRKIISHESRPDGISTLPCKSWVYDDNRMKRLITSKTWQSNGYLHVSGEG